MTAPKPLLLDEKMADQLADRIRPRAPVTLGAIPVPDVVAVAAEIHECYRERSERRWKHASARQRAWALTIAKRVLRAAGVLK